ncbi:tRNA pseudouridine65 synthase [Gramella sp. Hel_I_59]|uniref:RluA family pseudouridine synthase n=1 Tax=Gramella sp. Hel_I_59 TaxID=1249978 RepID=UPI00114DB27B|nr:RluA family pseudouridine synthase [Gramella sp. Hel_I_59]TQI72051.1 tRNA pseudouridine65 synthase [Gramella sp. Hel_I_59]
MNIIATHTVPAIEHKIRLQEYAISIFPQINSRSALKKAIAKKLVLLDGEKATTADWIQPGQKIELLEDKFQQRKIFKFILEVLYEDEYLAVVHKPSGIPTNGNYFRTLENALPHNLLVSNLKDALRYPVPVHRLDNPTAGIILIAKTRKVQQLFYSAFENKSIHKTYHTLVHGQLQCVVTQTASIDGKAATTIFEPVDNFEIEDEIFSLVKAKPITGRTHQIRIHLSKMSLPIVGDPIYGIEEGYFKNKNLFLFSSGISFEHPITSREMDFELKLPKRFRNLSRHKLS